MRVWSDSGAEARARLRLGFGAAPSRLENCDGAGVAVGSAVVCSSEYSGRTELSGAGLLEFVTPFDMALSLEIKSVTSVPHTPSGAKPPCEPNFMTCLPFQAYILGSEIYTHYRYTRATIT